MNRAKVVIGAQYGDEGKGLMTDYLCEKFDAQLVVRFNGGAQAGHTVTTPDGKRHVFGHFGSGGFLGVPTWLAPQFVVNPILYDKELKAMYDRNGAMHPNLRIDPSCRITTPYDMLINQMLEKQRGNGRHGSCGVGFGETIHRHNFIPLTYGDMMESQKVFRHMVNVIRTQWFPKRARQLGLDPEETAKYVDSQEMYDKFFKIVAFMRDCTKPGDYHILENKKTVVFEGAQGLKLDMDRGAFPHVTRSNTGLQNVIPLCDMANLSKVDVFYTTRSYVTRHGAGPLNRELLTPPYENIVDDTNIPHDFQGNLRFAYLDVDDLRYQVLRDLNEAYRPGITARLAITCLDQLDTTYGVLYHDGKESKYLASEFGYVVHRLVHLDHTSAMSYGPTRVDVDYQ